MMKPRNNSFDLVPSPRGQLDGRPEMIGYAPEREIASAPSGAGIEMSFAEILRLMRRQFWLVLAIASAIFAATVYLVLQEPPKYRANALIRLLDSRSAMTGGLADVQMERGIGWTADPGRSQILVMTSPAVLGLAVDAAPELRLRPITPGVGTSILSNVAIASDAPFAVLNLAFGPSEVVARFGSNEARARYGEDLAVGGIRFSAAVRPGVETASFEVLDLPSAVADLSSELRADIRQGTDGIDIHLTSPDPLRAQVAVNSVVEAYQSWNVQSARQQAERRRIFVQEQLQDTELQLIEAQHALSEFRGREQVFSLRARLGAQQEGVMEIEVQRGELDADRRMYQSLLLQLLGSNESGIRTLVSSPGIAANPVVSALYSQLVQYEVTRDTLTTGGGARTARNEDVQRVNALIAATEVRLLEAVQSHIAALNARISSLDELRARNASLLEQLPSTEAQEVRLLQQVETLQRMGDQLREEYQKARIAEAVEAGQVQVLHMASEPTVPVDSRRPLKLGLGLALGLMLGGGGAFLRETLNTSIRRRDDLEDILNVPNLAVIPGIAGATGMNRLLALGSGSRSKNGDSGSEHLVTLSDTRSGGAEAYQTLRTNLIFSQAVQTLRTIVVTSSAPGEGKTTTAANLAVAFAQQGTRVLLADCDLRKGRLHRLFLTPRSPGITEIILGQEVPSAAIRPTAVENLFLLPSGEAPPNPAVLLSSGRMRELIETLSERFDVVIFDTPPILAASDAAVLGSAVDGVVMVVRAGKTERDAAQQSIQQLMNVGAHVVGAVLNDPDSTVSKYGGHYQYEYYGLEEKAKSGTG
jgi:polysaccharide biosynthesis transport protein